MIDLDRIEKLAKEATPGDWVAIDFVNVLEHHTMKIPLIQRAPLGSLLPKDALFIEAANPKAIIELIKMIK